MNNIKKVKEYKRNNDNGVVTLSTGIRARFVAVPVGLIEEAKAEIKDPPVPMQEVEGKKHPQPNPNHPDYIAGCKEAERLRGQAGLDVLALFGVELEDGVPDNDLWIKKLRFLERKKQLNLSEYDLSDEIDRQFIYVKFVAMGNEDWINLGKFNGIRQEDIEQARDTFRS